ncbi:MAG: hypothetical protein LCH37_14100 [Bacteroidetes bacterium]|nr:hypothetical protein [Bacteroidota bacterium]
MDELTTIMNEMLFHLDNNRWISFSKSDSTERFKARDKLRAFGLIEQYSLYSWRLTGEGYKAIELGGFEEWYSNQKKEQKQGSSNGGDNISIITGSNNNINQSNLVDSADSKVEQKNRNMPKGKISLVERISWIVGIIAGIIAIYEFLLKDLTVK